MNGSIPAPAAPPPASDPSSRKIPLVLVFTDDPDRGGVAQYNHAVLLALVAGGYRVACAQARGASPLIEAQRAAGVEHHWLPYDGSGSDFARTLTDMDTPKRVFEATRPALIIFSDCCPVSNLAAHHAAVAMRIPFVIVVGFVAEYLAREAQGYLGVIARHYAQARAVIAVSADNLQLLRRHFGLAVDRGAVIHYGRPPEYFASPDPARRFRLRAELGIPDNAVVALTAARLSLVKGYRYQIAAIAGLEPRAAANLRFIWLGEGEQRKQLEQEIAARKWTERISLPGHRWNTPDWYDLADLFVLPSENEGMPLSIMEAMAKSLPVVASAISGIPEELGATGRLLPDPKFQPTATVRELTKTLSEWSQDGALRRKIGRACGERATLLFREEFMIRKTLAAVAAVLSVRLHSQRPE